MIVPIGHEESSTRRLPWITLGVIAICFAVFLATDVPSPSEPWSDEAALDEAADYWMQHAYLEPEPEIVDYVAFHIPPGERDDFVATLREVNPAPDDADRQAVQQLELDRLSKIAMGLSRDSENDYTRWGLTPAKPKAVNLLTHVFMHGGWLHLIGNLFLFFIAAPAVEDRWGRPLFATFFLAAGAFAGAFYAFLSATSSIPLVGASGAIAGVLGAFLVRFWKTRIRFMYLFFIGLRWLKGTFEAPAWLMLPLWFGNELLQAWIFHSLGASDGIAYWAHVGGFLFGVSAALLISTLKIEERFIHPSIESKVTLMEGNPVVEEAMQAREEGDLERAFSLLQDESRQAKDDTDLALAFWDTAVAVQRPESAAPAMLAAIRRTATRDAPLATQHWCEMTDVLPGALADPATLLRMLPLLLERDQQPKAILALRHASDARNSGLTAGLALRVIEKARELDPPSALQAAQQALRFDDIHESKRERLVQLIEQLESEGVEVPASAPVTPAQAGAMESKWDGDESIPLADEDGPAAVFASAAAAAAVAASPAGPRALAIDGELTDSGVDDQLALDPQQELGFDPTAELADIPEAEFGLDPDTELGLDPEAVLVEPDAVPDEVAAEPLDAMEFGVVSNDELDAEAEALPELAPLAPLAAPAAAPPPLPAGPPPIPASAAAEPPPVPTSATVEPPPVPASAAAEPPPVPTSAAAEPPPVPASAAAEPPPVAASPVVAPAPPPEIEAELVTDLHLGDSIDDADLRALIEMPRFSGVKVVDARPVELADNGLVLRLAEERKARIEYDKVQAIAVAAVGGLAKNPVLVIDLLLNWEDLSGGVLRLIRLRSDRFEPSQLVDAASSQMESIRLLLHQLIERTNAALLPDESAALAKPIHLESDLDSYQRHVLQAEA